MIQLREADPQGMILKVSLRHIRPPVWRRLLVPADITLFQLHNIIQVAMGWEDSHLHAFTINHREYGVPDPEFADDLLDESKVELQSVIEREKQKFLYTYDFGDNWEHEVLFEGRADNPDNGVVLLKGKRACPPEDCGGVPGYQQLLSLLSKSRLTRDEREQLQWYGGAFDPEALEIEDINEELADREIWE